MRKLSFIIFSLFLIIISIWFLNINLPVVNLPVVNLPDVYLEGYGDNAYAKYDSGALDIQYHDTIDNILNNDNIHSVDMNRMFLPDICGNIIEVDTPVVQGNILYYDPSGFQYSLRNYIPDYTTATYLSRTGTFANVAPQNYIQRIDYDEFSQTYSDFIPDDINANIVLPDYGLKSFPVTYFNNTEVGKYVALANIGTQPIVYGVTLTPVTTAAPKITKGILLVKYSSLNNTIGNQFQQTI